MMQRNLQIMMCGYLQYCECYHGYNIKTRTRTKTLKPKPRMEVIFTPKSAKQLF